MRAFLIWFAWLSLFGSFFDAAILAFVAALAAMGEAAWPITVGAHLKDHLPVIYWVKDLAYLILPDGLVDWIFGLPAIVYFPARIVISIVVGALALAAAARMATRQ